MSDLADLSLRAGNLLGPSLISGFSEAGKLFGLTVKKSDFLTDVIQGPVIRDNAAILVAEGNQKMKTTWLGVGNYHMDGADNLANYCAENGKALRYHTLFWEGGSPGDEVPAWLTSTLTVENRETLLRPYIQFVVQRYSEARSIDVINEMIATTADGWRAGYLLDAWESDGVQMALDLFTWAREYAAQGTRLTLNDFGMEHATTTATNKHAYLMTLLDTLAPAGVIDAVGYQSHLSNVSPFDAKAVKTRWADVTSLGLEVDITEFDVGNFLPGSPSNDEILRVNSRLARQYVETWLEADVGSEFLMWGTTNDQSWLVSKYPSYTQLPLPWDAAGKPTMIERGLRRALHA